MQATQTTTQTQHSCETEHHPVLFFDGVCGLCNRSINFLIEIDRRKVLRYAPLQGETAQHRLSPADRVNFQSMILLDCHGVSRKSTAIALTLIHIGGFWKVPGWLLWMIPRPLRNLGYSIIARNRYRFFGKTEACRLPRPGEQELFLP